MEVLYEELKEAQPVFRKKLVQLTCNNGQLLLSLARAITGSFSLLLQVSPTQRAEFSEKACGVLYELLAATEQCGWPLSQRTLVSTPWLVDTLLTNNTMVWWGRV